MQWDRLSASWRWDDVERRWSSGSALGGSSHRYRPHWEAAGEAFTEVEGRKREANLRRAYSSKREASLRRAFSSKQTKTHCDQTGVLTSGSTKLFFSHCWRGQESQQAKRRLYSALTDDGNVFWSDFLDLQAQGPVPWRNEIGVGIRSSNKVVALIDKEYLLSFNCLEEIAYAIHYHKPLVLGILDQSAWDLLTIVNGHKRAWEETPAAGCRALFEYDGQLFGPNKLPFSLRAVQEIFTVLSSINFCPCRNLDAARLGHDGVSERLCEFVAKDLDYTKEYAVLQSKADAWLENERPNRLLLSGKEEVKAWEEWIRFAQKAEMFPHVSETQQEFVSACVGARKRKLWLLKLTGGFNIVIIFLLMIASIILAVIASDKTKIAEAEALKATHQERVAATMLMSIEDNPQTTAQSRAMIRAAEIASFIDYPNLVAPRLLTSTTNLASAPLWFFHIGKHRGRVQSADFSPDGSSIVSCGYDGLIIIQPLPRDDPNSFLPTEANHTTLFCHGSTSEAMKVRWSPDGQLIAASCRAGESDEHDVIVWRAEGQSWVELSHYAGTLQVRSMAWHPSIDRQVLAIGDESMFLGIWDFAVTSDIAAVQPVNGFPERVGFNAVRALDWHHSGSYLASGSTMNEILIWEVSEDLKVTLIAIGKDPIGDDINAVAFSGDGSLLASAGDDNYVIVWDAAAAFIAGGTPFDPAQLMNLQVLPPHGAAVFTVAWTSSMQLLSGSHDELVRMYRPSVAADGARTVPFTLEYEMQGKYGKINEVVVSPGDPLLIAAPSHSNMISFWQEPADLGTKGPEQFKMNCTQEMLDAYNFTNDLETRGEDWTRDGLTFAASMRKGLVCVWERKGSDWEVTGALLAPGDAPAVRRINLSSSGQYIGIGDDLGALAVWQRDSAGGWAGPWGVVHGDQKTRSVAWSPDNSALAFGTQGGKVGLWQDPFSGDGELEILKELDEGGEWRALAFRQSPLDGCMVLAGAGTVAGIHIMPTGCSGDNIAPAVYEYDITISNVAWSSEGLLASAGFDGVILLHSFATGEGGLKMLAKLTGHDGDMRSISWSPNAPRLASSSVDKSVRLWKVGPPLDGAEVGEVSVTGWRADIMCMDVFWMDSTPERIACSRETETTGSSVLTIDLENPYTRMLEFMLVNFDDYVQLLNGLTYGRLTFSDLQALGYQYIAETVLDPRLQLEAP